MLLPQKDGGLWVGTLWSIIRVTSGNTNAPISPSNARLNFEYVSQTVGGHPTALAEAADGTIWAGTLDGFLMRWDGRQFVPLEPPDRKSLGRIWALWPAPDGSLWAGTEQGGLLHWHDGQFFRYTTQNGLPSDSIVQILGDVQGNLWLGTRAGIARILNPAVSHFESGKLNQLPVSVYGLPDGLRTIGSAIIYQPNCWRGRDGGLFFAMANSVAEVDPSRVHVNPLPPSVVLEELRMDGQTIWPHRAGAVLVASYGAPAGSPAPASVVVGPGRGDLEFRFAGPSLGSPQRVRFKYQLAGLDNSWNDAGADRTAGYRHVPPGHYTFRVIAYNSDSVSSGPGDLLTVDVRPHFYQTAWFRGGVIVGSVLVLSLIAALIIRARLHRRMEQLERQHALERERTRIAQDLHDDLGAGLTEVGLLGGLLQDPARLAVRKQEALDRIVERSHDMVVALDEIVWAVNPRNDSVNSAISYLARYAQSFLEPTAIRCRLEMREAEPDHPLNSEQRHNLFLAFKEALNNVAKHSGASEVRIKIECAPEHLVSISIEDNGRGLPAAIQSDADGLDNLRQRMTQIGGSCGITNVPAGGVAVHLSLPFDVHKK
jgi:signal transduction histidine kinase/streptogramin lyase